ATPPSRRTRSRFRGSRRERTRRSEAPPRLASVGGRPDETRRPTTSRRRRQRKAVSEIKKRDGVDPDAVERPRPAPRAAAVQGARKRARRLLPARPADADEDGTTVAERVKRPGVPTGDRRHASREGEIEVRG